jgi:hypothetical protein
VTNPIENERTYATTSGLKLGLKAAKLGHMDHNVRTLPDGKFAATIHVAEQIDKDEVESRGFTAVIVGEAAWL